MVHRTRGEATRRVARRLLAGAGAAGMLATLLLGGCDTTATFQRSVIQFDPVKPIELIAATPYKTEGGERVPACAPGDQAEGFFISFNLKSTEHKGSLAGNTDLQVRENDRVGDRIVSVGPGKAISASIFSLTLSCIEGYPDKTSACETDDGLPNPNATLEDIDFIRRSDSRKQPIAVAVLVDHSESMIGFGNQDRKEVKQGFVEPGKFSDPSHARYKAASEGLIKNLNDNDRLIAWYFNEDGVKLACSAPNLDQVTDPIQQERACFGTRHEWVAGAIDPADPTKSVEGAFTELAKGTIIAKGRTPLWAAVDHAWTFLMENAKTSSDGDVSDLPRHIVVITDSPDTCDPKSPNFLPDEPCATHLDYETFKAKVEAVPLAQRIPITFVQFQSYGYQQQDGAQMEAACLTGGVYRWINRLDYADSEPDFGLELQETLKLIRYTLGGVWRAYVKVPSLNEVDGGGNPLLPPGLINAMDGTLTLTPPNIVNAKEKSYGFNLSPPGDKRLLLRRTCTQDGQCPGGEDGDCFVSCNPQGSVCAWPWTNKLNQAQPGIPIGQGGACTLADQTEGTCCCGTCQATDAQCSVVQKPCCDSSVDLTCLD